MTDYTDLARRLREHANGLDDIGQALAQWYDIEDDPVSDLRRAADLLDAMGQQEPNYLELLQQAEQIVRSKSVWKRFIDGTPLSNDVAVWMADFAVAALRAQPQEQREPIDPHMIVADDRFPDQPTEAQRADQISLGALMQEQHRSRMMAGAYPDGNPNAGAHMAAQQPQPVLSGYGDYGAAIPGIERPCTCHPDDNPPVPCVQQYALNECRAAAQADEREPCIGSDPSCPCQDGDPCHYRDHGDTKAMSQPERQPVSEPTEAQIKAMQHALTEKHGINLLPGTVRDGLRAALAAKE